MATNSKKSTADTAPVPTEEVDKKAEAAACFEANPKAKQFFQTTDGQCFAEESNAKQHARRLGDNAWEEVTREKAEKAEAPQA